MTEFQTGTFIASRAELVLFSFMTSCLAQPSQDHLTRTSSDDTGPDVQGKKLTAGRLVVVPTVPPPPQEMFTF